MIGKPGHFGSLVFIKSSEKHSYPSGPAISYRTIRPSLTEFLQWWYCKAVMLELKPLADAVKSLESALSFHRKNPNDVVRDGCIQRFEYCYELSFKMVKRVLKEESPNPSRTDSLGFRDVIREAFAKNIVSRDLETWIKFRDCRNQTSHNYNQKIAEEIFQNIPDFLSEAQHLIKQLSKKADPS